MLRTIAVSSGWTTLVESSATMRPWAVTTLSIGISAEAAKQAATRVATIQVTPRAEYSVGTTAKAPLGEWKSSSDGRSASAPRRPRSGTPARLRVRLMKTLLTC